MLLLDSARKGADELQHSTCLRGGAKSDLVVVLPCRVRVAAPCRGGRGPRKCMGSRPQQPRPEGGPGQSKSRIEIDLDPSRSRSTSSIDLEPSRSTSIARAVKPPQRSGCEQVGPWSVTSGCASGWPWSGGGRGRAVVVVRAVVGLVVWCGRRCAEWLLLAVRVSPQRRTLRASATLSRVRGGWVRDGLCELERRGRWRCHGCCAGVGAKP